MKIAQLALASFLGSSSLLSAASNLLGDPGFELATGASQTSPSWMVNANQPDGTNFSAQFQNAPWASNPGGEAGTGLWLKAFEGNQAAGDGMANVTVSQTVAAMAGLTYDLSVWNKQETNFTAGSTFFAVDFLDGAGTVLGSQQSDITSHPKDGSWVQFSLSADAPAATTQALVRFGMVDGVDATLNPQSAMFDDVSFSTDAIPEPSSALLTSLALSAFVLRRRRSAR